MTLRSASLALLLLLALVRVARPSPFELGVGPGLPFTTEQLAQALAPRLGEAAISRLVVTAHGEGSARVDAAGLTRVVPFGDRTGTAAARVVALAISDLLVVDPTQPVLARLDDHARPVRPGWMIRLTGVGGAMKGAGSAERLGSTMSMALTAGRGDRLLRMSAGGWWIHEGEPGPTRASLQAWPIRIGAGIRIDDVHLSCGPIVMPYVLSGTAPRRGAFVGLGVSVDAGLRVMRGLRIVGSGGLDAFANRIEIRNQGEPTFATPRVALSLLLGLAVEVGP